MIKDILKHVESSEPVTYDDACLLMKLDGNAIFDLLPVANAIREEHHGNEVSLCSIINAKSGHCPEDCAFCSQSSHNTTDAPVYPMVEAKKIVERAKEAIGCGAREFSIVTSGFGVEKEDEIQTLLLALDQIKTKTGLERCASLGNVTKENLLRLKEAGLQSYHHNLETARSFFLNICTTHTYDEDVEAVQLAKEIGFKVCCGGIFGMGESPEQRVELALTLKELDVDSVPINFLNPIKGTKLENAHYLTPLECLKIIAVYRMILPTKDIFVCGGREVNLRDLQSMIFFAGANGMMTGGYLTTRGRDHKDDLKLIEDLGLKIKSCGIRNYKA